MRIDELRRLLNTADRANLEKAFAECYKQLRKGQKEEIDQILTDILEGKAAKKKKAEKAADFEELEHQIQVFIDNAYAQNYFAPNRNVPKSQRPRWRFMVKNFIKELDKISLESKNYQRAVKLLTDLYCLICEACNYYLFSTEDPFRSIGWAQYKFFELVVKKIFAAGYSRESISRLLVIAATGGLSRESLYIQQEMVLISSLRTSDMKYMAIEEAKKLIEGTKEKLSKLGNYDDRRYEAEEAVNEFCGVILLLSVELAEAEKGVKYYFKNSQKADKEITLYCVLRLIGMIEENDLWIEVYEYGKKKEIEPRDSLQAEYEERKEWAADRAAEKKE